MSADYPLVTVVTPCFNSARYLEETIQSIQTQDYPNIEHLVMDGGSTDCTLDFLRLHESTLAWVSEPDQGQSDAINKGITRARGEIVAWLNGDDAYTPGAVARAVAALAASPAAGVVYGASTVVDADGQIVAEAPAEPFDRCRLLNEGDFICQPTVFMRRAALTAAGPLRTDLHYCMDYDLWLRLSAQADFAVVPGPALVRYRLHADAKTTYIPYGMVDERYRISAAHGGDPAAVALHVLGIKWSIHASEDFARGPRWFRDSYLGAEFVRLDADVRRRSRQLLANACVQSGFRCRDARLPATAAAWMREAVRNDPDWLRNRGVLKVILAGMRRAGDATAEPAPTAGEPQAHEVAH